MTEIKKTYWSRHVQDLTPYVPGEQLQDRRYIKLNTNEHPYGPGEKVLERLKAIDANKLRFYPDPTAYQLRLSIASKLGVNVEEVFVGNGSDEVLDFSYKAFFNPIEIDERPLLSPDPTYSFYPVFAQGNRMYAVTTEVNEDFTVDLDELISSDSQGVVLANPNAPTGQLLSLDEISIILAALEKQKRFCIIDEAYIDFGGKSAVSLLDQYPNFIVVQTFSKSRGLAGLRLGFAIGREEHIVALERIRDSINSYTVDMLAQDLGKASMEDDAWFERSIRSIVATRDRFTNEVKGLGLDVVESKANFVLVGIPGMTGLALYEALRQEGILVRYLSHPRLVHLVRVSIGTDEEMAKVLVVLKKIQEGLREDA